MCLAIPGKITHIDPNQDIAFRLGKVSFGGVQKEVNLMMVPEAKEGDYILVHVGVGMCIVDQSEAKKTFQFLRELGELEDLALE